MVASPWKRILAFGIDWFLILIYGSLLFGAVILFAGEVKVSNPYNVARLQALGFVSLTLPVLIYFIASEYFWGASVGKRIMRLQLVTPEHQRPKLGQVVLRTCIKFLPWELAHFCVHHLVAAGIEKRDPSAMVMVLLIGVYVLAGYYLLTMFRGEGRRTLYDRLAGTQVVAIG